MWRKYKVAKEIDRVEERCHSKSFAWNKLSPFSHYLQSLTVPFNMDWIKCMTLSAHSHVLVSSVLKWTVFLTTPVLLHYLLATQSFSTQVWFRTLFTPTSPHTKHLHYTQSTIINQESFIEVPLGFNSSLVALFVSFKVSLFLELQPYYHRSSLSSSCLLNFL